MNTGGLPNSANLLLADDDAWLVVGSRLYRIAELLLEQLDDERFQRVVVGLEVGYDHDGPGTIKEQLKDQAAMLFGMALEAWMKGFLAKMHGSTTFKSHETTFAQRVKEENVEIGSCRWNELAVQLWDGALAEIVGKVTLQKHQLRVLAEQTQVLRHLNRLEFELKERVFNRMEAEGHPVDAMQRRQEQQRIGEENKTLFEALGFAIHEGRYPGHWDTGKTSSISEHTSNTLKWDLVRRAIHQRFEDLYPGSSPFPSQLPRDSWDQE